MNKTDKLVLKAIYKINEERTKKLREYTVRDIKTIIRISVNSVHKKVNKFTANTIRNSLNRLDKEGLIKKYDSSLGLQKFYGPTKKGVKEASKLKEIEELEDRINELYEYYINPMKEEYGTNKWNIEDIENQIYNIKQGIQKVKNKQISINCLKEDIREVKKRNKEIIEYLREYRTKIRELKKEIQK